MSLVNGFGANPNEIRDQKMIPEKLTAFRKFRFRPYAGNGNTNDAWIAFNKTFSKSSRPCLTGTTYTSSVYWTAGEQVSSCQDSRLGPVSYSLHQALSSKGVIVRDGLFQQHPAPDRSCSCGFWAYYSPDVINIGAGISKDWTVLAAVKVWGNVVLGDKGVRAEKMEIVGLQPPRELMRASKAILDAWTNLTQKLGVPYFWNEHELLGFFPPQNVSELIPKPPEPEPPPGYPYELWGTRDPLRSPHLSPRIWEPGWSDPVVPGYTHYTNNTNPMVMDPLPPSPSPQVSVVADPPVTYYRYECCVCGRGIVAPDGPTAKRRLAEHILDTHPNP